ncbi:glycosyltransferase [Clostridiaceae bacterium]|nr:glycosyltransferase [Clostridiaceae bacterium]
MKGILSVILPAYNENKNIEKSYTAIDQILSSHHIAHELVYINDGSTDSTWNEICKLSKRKKEHSQVMGICFSRNFGKEAAIMAGLAYASGTVCAVMDCDLQHPPEKLVEMYQLWQQGYKVVEGVKRNRGRENVIYKTGAKIFYHLMTFATKMDMSRASDFKLLDKQVVNSILSMPERNQFFRASSSWVGYKKTEIEFDVREREFGQSKWSKWSLIKYALKNIAAFSTFPLQLITVAGMITLLGAIILTIQTLFRYYSGTALEGFTTVILLLLIISSIVMVSIGILGYYIAKIYEEVKQRPVYIISDII